MPIFLAQHGQALPKDQDPDGGLSPEGEAVVGDIARRAFEEGVKVNRIEHSNKTRARGTAVIFARALSPPGGMAERYDIGPKDDVSALARSLDPASRVMIVGHLPFLEKLAALMVAGTAESAVVKFQNGGIVCLDRDDGAERWHVKWTLTPGLD